VQFNLYPLVSKRASKKIVWQIL